MSLALSRRALFAGVFGAAVVAKLPAVAAPAPALRPWATFTPINWVVDEAALSADMAEYCRMDVIYTQHVYALAKAMEPYEQAWVDHLFYGNPNESHPFEGLKTCVTT